MDNNANNKNNKNTDNTNRNEHSLGDDDNHDQNRQVPEATDIIVIKMLIFFEQHKITLIITK